MSTDGSCHITDERNVKPERLASITKPCVAPNGLAEGFPAGSFCGVDFAGAEQVLPGSACRETK